MVLKVDWMDGDAVVSKVLSKKTGKQIRPPNKVVLHQNVKMISC